MEYKYNDKTQLTKNINVSELRCHCGKNHNIIIDLDHINNVQEFMNINGYDKVIFSSGYRCPNHDKKVGGSGKGQHTKGTATDQRFYKKGSIAPAKEVCCKAQDFGFKGIAYIDKNHVHLDNRVSGKYRGDERKGRSNNVPKGNFYAYFGIERDKDTYKGIFPTLPSRSYFKKWDKGIQVKYLQEFLNWANDAKLSMDSIIGDKTIAQVKAFQKNVGIKADGLFGKDSLSKAKSYKK